MPAALLVPALLVRVYVFLLCVLYYICATKAQAAARGDRARPPGRSHSGPHCPQRPGPKMGRSPEDPRRDSWDLRVSASGSVHRSASEDSGVAVVPLAVRREDQNDCQCSEEGGSERLPVALALPVPLPLPWHWQCH